MPPDHQELHAEVAEPSDLQLIARTRAGDSDAYAALFSRHQDLALLVARGLGGPGLADDIVAEAFVRIFALLKEGKGPQRTFGAYLKLTLRSVYVDHVRRDARLELSGDATYLPELPDVVDPMDARVEATLVTQAFAGLAPRAQLVLWLSEVDDVPPAEIAELMGLSPNAVGQLAFRARESLRQGYLAEHLSVVVDPECQEVAEFLPAYVRGALSVRRVDRVDRHVTECARCALALAELQTIESQLRALLLPLLPPANLGIGVSAGARQGEPLPFAPVLIPPSRFARVLPGQGLVAATVVGLCCALTASLLLRVMDDDPAAAATPPDVATSPAEVSQSFGTPPVLVPGVPPSETSSVSPSASPTDVEATPGAPATATATGSPTQSPSAPTEPTEPTKPTSPPIEPSPTSPSEQTTVTPRTDVSVAVVGARLIGDSAHQWLVDFEVLGARTGAIAQLAVQGEGAVIESVTGSGWKCGPAKVSAVVCEAGGDVSGLRLEVAAQQGAIVSLSMQAVDGDPNLSNDSASISLLAGTG